MSRDPQLVLIRVDAAPPLWCDSRSRAVLQAGSHAEPDAAPFFMRRATYPSSAATTHSGFAYMLSPRSAFPLAPITLAVSLALSGCAISVEAPQSAPAPAPA
ncbi:hypothetical protein IP84_10265, partial [beta proteobacterium AAP99]